MDDRDFLGYFGKLGNPNVEQVKQASNNIVSTLLALDSKAGRRASMDSLASVEESKVKQKAEAALKQKYSQGDLGEKMNADLNYALKRLVRGLYSDNHAVKQGFFLASVMVLSRFKASIDFEKYIAFVKEETKTNSGMKNPEIHAMLMGRLMCVSAVLESGWIGQGNSQGQQQQLLTLLDILIEIYRLQEFLREAIQVIISKVLRAQNGSVKIFDYLVQKLLINSDSKQGQLESAIFQSSSSLSLYLTLKGLYLEFFDGQSKEFNNDMQLHFIKNKKHLHQISSLIKSQTYLFPRLHSSVPLLIEELFRDKKQMESNFTIFSQVLLEEAIFNEAVHDSMKSVAKFKYLHIGLKMVESLLKQARSSSTPKQRLAIVETLLLRNNNFRTIFIRNVQMPKNQLHEQAKLVKAQFVGLLTQMTEESSDESKDLALRLLKGLFGPNSFTHFSAKKNQDLLIPLAGQLDKDQIQDYIENWLLELLSAPNAKEFYPEESTDAPNEDRDQDSTLQKQLTIQQFALAQLASMPVFFKNTLSSQHVMLVLNLLVKTAYLQTENNEIQSSAQFKLFGMVGQLQKMSIAGSGLRKGYCKENELWCLRVNKLANKVVGDNATEDKDQELDVASLTKRHKKYLKFVEKNISQARAQVAEALTSLNEDKDKEMILKHKAQLRQLAAIETLFLNLTLLVLVPQALNDQTIVMETLEDIEELKECFGNLGIDKVQTGKKAKKTEEEEAAQKEAQSVLIDFLTSMLTKPQSFLREVANTCFKHFCVKCVDEENLWRLLGIVGTANKEAGDFMEGDKDPADDGEDFDEDAELADEASSDDSA